jgi:hypothetical protein
VNAHPPARCKSRCESTVEARPREEKAKGALDGWTLRTAPSSSAAAERGERDRRVAGKQEGARGICVGGYGAGELKEGIRSAIRWGPTGLPYPTLGSGARPRGGRGPGPRARSTCPLPPVAIALQRRLGDLRLRACVGARRLGGKDGELSALLVLAAAGPPCARARTDGGVTSLVKAGDVELPHISGSALASSDFSPEGGESSHTNVLRACGGWTPAEAGPEAASTWMHMQLQTVVASCKQPQVVRIYSLTHEA